MRFNRKRIVRIALALIALVVVGLVATVLVIDRIAKMAIEYAGTTALGVDTTLDGISIGILRPSSSLDGLQVANPIGFDSNYFIRLEHGVLDMSLGNLLNETVEIERLKLSGINVNLVRENQGANFRQIISNIREFQSKQEKQPTSGEKKFRIREVLIEDVKVNVDLLPFAGKLTQLDVPIKELRLENVGSDELGGENLSRIVSTVVYALLEAVIAKSESVLPPGMAEELSETLSELKPLETFRAIRENVKERREERLERQQAQPVPPGAPPDRPVGPIRQRLRGRLERPGE